MDEEFVGTRIAQLRIRKGISAREMSLALGQGEGYITHIENGHGLPSMQVFFYICEYFRITPQQFFDDGNKHPQQLDLLISKLKKLDPDTLIHLDGLIDAIIKS